VLKKNAACFSKGGIAGEALGVFHCIDTGDSQPISTRPRRTAPGERRVIAEQVSQMLQDGIIEPSNSPWSSAVVLAAKKNGGLRFCIDYRALNAVTKKDVYPLPRIDDLLQKLAGSTVFSSLDLTWGYWHVLMHPDHKEKTAFIAEDGLYQFIRMQFGASNSPATFMRLIDQVLVGLKWTQTLAYLDDLLVHGPNFQEHLRRLDVVLTALTEAGLRLNPEKCSFGVDSIVYLGHEVNHQGIRPDPGKMEAVANFPVPFDVRSLRSYLGLVSFYRRFVVGFARQATPLYDLLKKDVIGWPWGPEQQAAFQALKDAVIAAPTLYHDNETDRLVLRTDAAKIGLGAILSIIRDGKEWPVTCISRRTTLAERNYHSNELECLALVWALQKLRHHLFGRSFTVYTDNIALRWLQTKKEIGGKLGRWILALQEFDFDIHHIKGEQNIAADALSRYPVGDPEETDPTERMVCSLVIAPFQHSEVAVLQQGDPSIRPILLDQRDPALQDGNFKIYRHTLYKKAEDSDRKWVLVVPSILRREVLAAMHSHPTAGHLGQAKTYYRVKQRYWWPGLEKTVKAFVSSCRHCQFYKPATGSAVGRLMPILPPRTPFHTIGMDHLGPFRLTERGNQYIFVSVDYLTKWVIAVPVADTTTANVIAALRSYVFGPHGFAQRIITDQGTAFTSLALTEFLDRLGVELTFASGERPQTNGLTERMNRTLVSVFRTFVCPDQTDWDEHIPWAALAINTARHDVTGRSPFELVYGRVARLPFESVLPSFRADMLSYRTFRGRVKLWRRAARDLIVAMQARTKARFDTSHRLSRNYEKGDLVLVARKFTVKGRSRKLLPKFIGPFQIARKKCENTYLVEDIPVLQKRKYVRRFNAHVAQLRPFRTPAEEDWCPEEWEADEDTVAGEECPVAVQLPLPSIEDTHPIESTPVVEVPYVTRSGRAVRTPSWLLDH